MTNSNEMKSYVLTQQCLQDAVDDRLSVASGENTLELAEDTKW